MLLYNNSILSENMFTVDEEPKDFKAEINRSQMDYLTNMNAVTKEYLHDLAYANGEAKIVTEAIDTYIAKAKALWKKFLAWIKEIFQKWVDFINSLYHKPTTAELLQRALSLAQTRGADLAGFRFKGTYALHKEYCQTLEVGFVSQVKVIRPAIRMMEKQFIGNLKMKDFDPGLIESSMEKTIKQIGRINDTWKNEKPTNNITAADIIYVVERFNRMSTAVRTYQNAANDFTSSDLDWMFEQFDQNVVYKRYPFLQKVMEGLAFAIQNHIREMVDMSNHVLADYQKLLGAWYPAATNYLYNR